MPTFNRLEYLRAAVASVYAQTFEDWELIVIDDGSGDETRRFLRSPPDPRMSVVFCSHTRGTRPSFAIKASRGHAADTSRSWTLTTGGPPEKLQRQLALMESKPARRWSYTAVRRIDADGQRNPLRAPCRGFPIGLDLGASAASRCADRDADGHGGARVRARARRLRREDAIRRGLRSVVANGAAQRSRSRHHAAGRCPQPRRALHVGPSRQPRAVGRASTRRWKRSSRHGVFAPYVAERKGRVLSVAGCAASACPRLGRHAADHRRGRSRACLQSAAAGCALLAPPRCRARSASPCETQRATDHGAHRLDRHADVQPHGVLARGGRIGAHANDAGVGAHHRGRRLERARHSTISRA